jgi:dipeptidyl aminopeptidase/acylaminoacyl peptidase
MKSCRKGRFKSAWAIGTLLALILGAPGCGPESYSGRFLASWSPDGTRAAVVPNLLDDIPDSGIWIFDARSGRFEQIFASNNGSYCIHPQWSPFVDEILFATVAKEEKETKDATDQQIRYSIWVIGDSGYGLRKIADSTSRDNSGDSSIPRIALPNTVAWGALPGTVIFQEAVGDKVTAILLDPYTGRVTEFLPHPADAYSIEPSPSRTKVAAVLYDEQAETAEVFLSDFGFGNWQRLATIGFDPDQLDRFSPMIFWSPDSSGFVIPEEDHSFGLKEKPQFHLSFFDLRTGRMRRTPFCNPNTSILWDREGRSFYFSGTEDDGDSESAVYRVDRETGRKTQLLPPGNDFLVSVNRVNSRIYFYRSRIEGGPGGSGEKASRLLFSCADDGGDVRELVPWPEGDSMIWSLTPDGSGTLLLEDQPRLSIFCSFASWGRPF